MFSSAASILRGTVLALLAGALLALAGCGANTCTVKDNGDGTKTISCGDGTSATVTDGKAGGGCTVKDNGDGTKTISCADGTKVIVRDGDAGTSGQNGPPGQNGNNGSNGTNGANGANGANGGNDQVSNFHGQVTLQQIDFNKSGKFHVDVVVNSATADAMGVATVKFTVTDANKATVAGISPASMSFNISRLVPADAAAKETFVKWVPYIFRMETAGVGDWNNAPYNTPANFTTDQGYREDSSNGGVFGTVTDNKDGSYTYVFKTDLSKVVTPATKVAIPYERNRLHRVSVMMGGHAGATGTGTFDFVPDGTKAPESRNIIQTANCQACHGTTFAGHGGDRMTIENCATCHTPMSFDAQSGNTLDLKVLIHKIHAGKDMDSTAGPDGIVWDDPATKVNEAADNGTYAIWGYMNTKAKWWDIGFPAIVQNCEKCHTGGGEQVNNWKAVPSRVACGSCHDTTSYVSPAPAGMVLHGGGAIDDDGKCAVCHPAAGAIENPSYPIPAVHDFMNLDPRNVPEYLPEVSVSTPQNGSFFVAGERPVVTIKLRDAEKNGTPYIDHTTFVADDGVNVFPPGDGAEGCPQPNLPGVLPYIGKYTACPPKDGKFTSASLFVSGPRAARNPVLSTIARVVMKSTMPGPFALSGASLSLILDGGRDIAGTDASGGDFNMPAAVSVSVNGASTTGEVAANPAPQVRTFTDASQQLLGNLKTWRNHQFAGSAITVTDNSTSGKPSQTANVLDNVNALVTTDADITYVQGHVYTYSMSTLAGAWSNLATSGSTTQLLDGAQSWKTDQWKGWTVKIVSGSGAGQKTSLAGNTATTLTFNAAVNVPVDNTSVYQLVPFNSVAAATPAEVVSWLNANATFANRAIAYLDSSAIASATTGALAASGTSFTITTGNGVMFAAAGNLILDRFTPAEETLGYTRSGDVFTITTMGGATLAHGAKATVQVNNSNIVAIRSRNLGLFYSVQGVSSTALSAVFPAEGVWLYPVHVIGSNAPGATDTKGTASTASNKVAKQTDAFKNDPAVSWSNGAITYQLDPVDDLAAGTYIAKIEFADRGAVDGAVNYKTPTVARVKFQVKSGTEELPPAANCGMCHTAGTDDATTENQGKAEPEKGFIVDNLRHHKILNNTAVDLCGNCHDYQSQNASGDWSGAYSASRRMHGVHNGAQLNFPNATIGHADTIPGRNWDIVFPQDVRNCDATCHVPSGPNQTSGTWKTKAARIPCMGCHDAPEAQAHFKAMTFDPTPLNPFSGDEQESCRNCH